MRISLQQIETFYWVARLGGFHAAARHQHLTQPTISARIQEFEEHLGVRLFERSRSRSELTLAGRDALANAEQMLKLADKLECIGKRRDPMQGLLRLGANESIAQAGLAELLTHMKTRYPQMKIELTIDVGVTLGRKLGARELDVAILNDSTDAPNVVETAIGHTDLHWVASPLLVPDRVVTPLTLAPVPIITVSQPSSNHSLVMNWFRNAGCTPENISSCNSLSTMLRLVAAGHAAAVLSPAIMRAELEGGLIHVLNTERPVIQQAFYVAYQDERHGGMDTIVKLAKDVLTRSRLLIPD
ncbi:DNA-binding transcriptional LysR family regulator [Paraburkholderia sp. UCT70]|uniref:LysR family transcriptional regulator n=1 Tax=Paraburkholderia sp. UCT70 TaxID=2991068 RepID=UPI003D1EA5B3